MPSKTTFPGAALFVLTVLFSQSVFSQNQLTGTVVEPGGKPLYGATVLLLKSADSSLVKGQLSGLDGGFKFEEVGTGGYFLRATMLGFEEFQSEIFSTEEKSGVKKWPTITLPENSKLMKEVQIVAKKPFLEQKIDRLVVNVAGSSVNAGGNALQVLQRSPGVLVNKQTNSISMTGKFGVIIMVNGKVSNMPDDAVLALLEGTIADNIERIELIHTPPANYDAEGNAGIINIVLKKSGDEGLNGNYNLSGGYGRGEKYGAGLNFNYRKKSLNLFGDYSYRTDHSPHRFTNYRGIRRDGNFIETDGISRRDATTLVQNGRLGADFQVSKKTVVGVVGTFFDRYWDMLAKANIENRVDGKTDSTTRMTTREINHSRSLAGNANFSHQFSARKTLTADVDYVAYKYHNPSSYDIQNTAADGTTGQTSKLRVSKETPIELMVAKADYVQNFGNENTFEAGVKGARSLFDNDVRVERLLGDAWTSDPTLTSRFKLNEDVLAAYASVGFKATARTDFKLGLRYEFTQTNLGSKEQPDVVDRAYGRFFPSIFIGHKLTDNQQLNLSFSRRIWRPGFTQLAPYLIFYDPTTVQSGNPELQPAFVNAIRADYRYKVVGLTVEYNHESPSIRDLPFVDVASNTQVSRPANIGKTHTAYAMVNFPWQPAKFWDMQASFFYAYQLFNDVYEGKKYDIPVRFAGMNASQTFKLPQKFSIDLSGNFMTAPRWGIVKNNPNGSLNIGLQKDFGETWGKVTFNVNDIFQTGSNYRSTTDQPELNLLVKSAYLQSERAFMLTWANKFGNKKLKDARQRDNGAADEMRRL